MARESYNRHAHILQQIARWQTQQIQHTPIHPALTADTKAFEESFAMGRLMEELIRPLLYLLFPQAVIIAHCDTTIASRSGGKRVSIAGREYVLPDFEIHDAQRQFHCCLDVKSKQYHSWYHRDEQVQQFINAKALDAYLSYATAREMVALVVFHLWPSLAMHAYGQSDHPRIHTGIGYPVLCESMLTKILRYYPVDDEYYLIRAIDCQRYGRSDLNRRDAGLYVPVRYMSRGTTQGSLPPFAVWQALATKSDSL